jgi:hypothetical protein
MGDSKFRLVADPPDKGQDPPGTGLSRLAKTIGSTHLIISEYRDVSMNISARETRRAPFVA